MAHASKPFADSHDAGHTGKNHPAKDNAMPLDVIITTAEYEIHGLIYVSRTTRKERRLSELLNDGSRRFLAVTDARIQHRNGPNTPRVYSFLQLQIDSIQMLHPAAQLTFCEGEVSGGDKERFVGLRKRVKQSGGKD